ncbi:hypothetical protein EIN_155350 [Entamoeba invadens IP1]|uniref:Coiled-coil domain-containing protein 86 n=1 Tax=Entamoeba invadens IP1 TaxID=370355 RepID=A0A0A1UCP2_ENTIV|nr:hypothetical protein EIN_155350 [Entamoeba invadens IP1]ELP91428.1 hypothetical protein EIN_155350 [Entamoeba invadens IP1]|eukprot:XP_004258199.1 hypothetical protein EIN_155350 [Entamoeba invadens IP1]
MAEAKVVTEVPKETTSSEQSKPAEKTKQADDLLDASLKEESELSCSQKEVISKPIQSKNVSGRPWKQTHQKRSVNFNVNGAGMSWDEKMAIKARRKIMQKVDAEIMARKEEEEAKRKEARKESIIRKKQNILKNTVVQQVTNKNKIRHMTPKQYKQLKSYHFDEIE